MVKSGGYSLQNGRSNSGEGSEMVVVETDGTFHKQQEAMTSVPLETNGHKNENGVKVDNVDDSATKTSADSSDIEGGKGDKKEKQPMVGVLEVFRFADCRDRLLMLVGMLAAVAHGSALPIMIIVLGEVTDLFIDDALWMNIVNTIAQNISETCAPMCGPTPAPPHFDPDGLATFCRPGIERTTPQLPTMVTATVTSAAVTSASTDWQFCNWCVNITGQDIADNISAIQSKLEMFGCTEQLNEIDKYLSSISSDFMDNLQLNALYFTYVGCAVIILGYLQMMCWHNAAYNQSQRIRTQLLRAILRQDIGWFDTHDVGELNTRLVSDVNQIERGIGDKLALLCQYLSAFVSGFVIGFVYGWKLALVTLSVSPLLAIAGSLMAMSLSNMTKKELAAYAKAGAVAEEVLSAIRTVVAFGGQEKEALRYASNLQDACNVGMKKGLANGLGMGAVFFVTFGSYALGFWYGSQLTLSEPDNYSAGTMLIVFFSIQTGTFYIGASSPSIQDFANARGAAYIVYRIIDQVPPIDSSSDAGLKPEEMTGNIEFKDVVFRYPSRPEIKVLSGFNLKVNVGQTVALVGSSGCGKSTSVQLLQRFYDTLSGQVLIDGIDVKDYNVKWLRQNIGVVSQEPVLFGLTIAENIRFGREGATQEDIEKAAKQANAHDFISQLPLKYETLVGERGAQLSGGQKQRIAIARALVRDPKILLLDEATSALDTESEGIVQAALDRAREGRTTIVIAHRLSTIQTADIIAGVVAGFVVEKGTHQELMQKGGVYYTLVTNQKQMQEADEVEEIDAIDKVPLKRELSADAAHDFKRQRSVSVLSKKSLNEVKEEKVPPASILRIMKLNSPEWLTITIGCCGAVVMGCVQPAFAIFFAGLLGVFAESDPDEKERKFNLYSIIFAAIGAVSFFAMFICTWALARSGEFLTMRLRDMTFRSFLRMEIAYFDDHQNNTGALCSRLSTDAAAVQGATGSRLSTLIQAFGSIGLGVVIGFIYSWQLTLVVLAFAPFMLLTGLIEMKIIQGTSGERNKKMEAAAKIAVEAIENIRTVATLTQEDKLFANYCDLVAIPYNTNRRKSHLTGLAYSFSQACIYFANAAAYYYGGWLVVNAGLSYENMFKVLTAILFGAMAAGQASSFAPDYGKAKVAAARLFALFDRVPPIDSSSEAGDKLPDVTGSIEFRGVQFRYPTRPDIQVLKGLDIKVEPGKKVALVGSSGCGKSTVVQLVERFYDPLGGKVLLDERPIDSLHLQWFRRQIGIVSQEPILFDCSIRENIAYGDNFRQVSMDEIIEAARKANIHSFIETLPQGYETNVGDKGTQLSGGQKQRVAIARALVRSPKVLLLDEATSALDTESEKIVQEALERAQDGRTSIVIAHRLSTIQNADCIIVIQSGKVTEIGTHSELLAQRGFYYRLNLRRTTVA